MNNSDTNNPYQPPKKSSFEELPESNNLDLDSVMKGQKIIIYTIIGKFIINGITRYLAINSSTDIFTISLILGFIILGAAIYGAWKLSSGLGYQIGVKILILLSTLIPLVNLIVLIFLSTRATKVLKNAGYKVGFFGVKK